MIYAVYRCLYGEDFIQESIKSIDSVVDKIFVFYDDVPWGNVTSVNYLGEEIIFPKKFDNIIEKILEMNNPKIHIQKDHVYDNNNQFTHFVNNLILKRWPKPDIFMFIEVDHIFQKNQLLNGLDEFEEKDVSVSTFRQIELWKYPHWMIPIRDRVSVLLWKMKDLKELPPTLRQGEVLRTPRLSSYVHNYGFCYRYGTMYWKHLTAMAFSDKIKDSPPNERWLEDTWIAWDPINNNKDLEISLGSESNISHAFPYVAETYGPLPERSE